MDMNLGVRDRMWCCLYLAIAAAALVATQWTLAVAVTQGHSISTALSDLVASPASTFVTIDLGAVAVAGIAFMVAEGLRLKMRHLWVFVALTFLVAISVSLPLFLAVRHRRLAKAAAESE